MVSGIQYGVYANGATATVYLSSTLLTANQNGINPQIRRLDHSVGSHGVVGNLSNGVPTGMSPPL